MIFISIILYFAPQDFVAAYFLAVFFHEAGHVLCLLLFRRRIYSARLELKGLLIEHEGGMSELEVLLCAAAGPITGLLFAYASSFLAHFSCPDFFNLCAGLSLALSIFNALPIIPLDGAAAFKSLMDMLGIKRSSEIAFVISISFCAIILALGICLMSRGMGYGITAMSLILLFGTLFDEGIVKKCELS